MIINTIEREVGQNHETEMKKGFTIDDVEPVKEVSLEDQFEQLTFGSITIGNKHSRN